MSDPPEVADPLAPLDRTEPPVGPRPIRRTRRGQWVTGIVVAVVIFVVMLGTYAFGGGNAVRQPDVTFPPGGAAVFLSVRSVSADGADTPTNDQRDHDRPFSADSSRNVPGRSPASDA